MLLDFVFSAAEEEFQENVKNFVAEKELKPVSLQTGAKQMRVNS